MTRDAFVFAIGGTVALVLENLFIAVTARRDARRWGQASERIATEPELIDEASP
jgi:hypothetical protein